MRHVARVDRLQRAETGVGVVLAVDRPFVGVLAALDDGVVRAGRPRPAMRQMTPAAPARSALFDFRHFVSSQCNHVWPAFELREP